MKFNKAEAIYNKLEAEKDLDPTLVSSACGECVCECVCVCVCGECVW